ncbi:MAG: DUF2877 domain-containing protein [Candidatus Methanomethylicia archaeon]|jgi:hypothetical protein|nr:DUF2877 domain-containing protein [Candidatus Methanomethylicia archaeon]
MLKLLSLGADFKKAVDEKLAGKVVLVSRRALLIDVNGTIFEMLSSKMPRSTISAVLSRSELKDLPINVGDPVSFRESILLNGIELSPQNAEVWAWNLKKRYNLSKRALSKVSEKIENILSVRHPILLNEVRDPLLRATLEKIYLAFSFCKSYFEKEPNQSMQAVLDIVGLGPGLTPAGDDALAGFLIGTYYFTPRDHPLSGFLNGLRNEIGCKTTTAYSKRLLGLAVNGISNEYVRGLILGIAHQNYYALTINSKKILRLGATSGYFFLLGFMKGLEMIAL